MMMLTFLNPVEVLRSEYSLCGRSPLLVFLCSDPLHLIVIVHHIFDHYVEGMVVFGK